MTQVQAGAPWQAGCAWRCVLAAAAAMFPQPVVGEGSHSPTPGDQHSARVEMGRANSGGGAADDLPLWGRRPGAVEPRGDASLRRLTSLFPADRKCNGHERQWATCRGLPRCTQPCVPRDCMFAAWADWYSLGGCTGLCARQRSIAANSNDCGKPCKGSKIQTIQRDDCLPTRCGVTSVDCSWAAWNEWSGCPDSGQGQSNRTRKIFMFPVNSGIACSGPWRQTRPCRQTVKINCKLSEWNGWTECSASCGGGFKARMRHILHRAQHGGRPCAGVTRQTLPCNTHPCLRQVKPCIVSEWEEWDGCDAKSRHQKYRRRSILQASSSGAGHCSHVLLETEGCSNDWSSPSACHHLSEWTGWSECSEPCDGQSYRTRHLDHTLPDPSCSLLSLGPLPLRQVVSCKRQDCILGTEIHLSEWSDWGPCSADKCSVGSTTRSREILEPGLPRHSIRLQALEMVKACEAGTCTPTDCRWGSWEAWSTCSRSCDGGEMHRSRMVQDPPQHGGRSCAPKDRSEVAPCNTQTCIVCLDGTWGEWGQWSSCTATCDHGFQVRHRDVMQYPNDCGVPANGLEDEYRLCRLALCEQSRDCELTPWGEWSSCTATCIGVKERRRRVTNLAASKGTPCVGTSLKEISPCTSTWASKSGSNCGLSMPRACLLAPWGSWSECCTAAGKGMRRRTRHVLVPNANNGPSCEGPLSEVAECDVASSEDRCQDCRWSAWSSWGGCSSSGGQRYRQRSVTRMPNYCGQACEAMAAKEVGSCPRSPAQAQARFCAWSAWSELGGCSATCGTATKLRRRELQLLDERPGAVVEWVGAGNCISNDGSKYTRWLASVRSKEECQMLLKILLTMPFVRGAQYNVDLRTCDVVVDQYADPRGSTEPSLWHVGRDASRDGPASGPIFGADGIPNRTCWRLDSGTLLKGDKQMPCAGSQIYVAACDFVSCIQCTRVECRLSPWGSWSAPSCMQLCERRRTLAQPATCGGPPCQGSLVETRHCARDCSAEKQDCSLSQWGEWSPTECTQEVRQRIRHRRILSEATGGGWPCEGPLQEARACPRPKSRKAPCEVAAWMEWTSCSRDCDGGFRTRSRSIAVEAAGGASPCSATLEEMELCNVQPCEEVPCQLTAWAPWSGCSASGVRIRRRSVSQRPSSRGSRCIGALREAKVCSLAVDCALSPWTDWGDCDGRCGGQQQRQRQVFRNPANGGKPCAQHLAETRGCNAGACHFVSCELGSWMDWGPCTTTCGQGQQKRQREVVRLAGMDGLGCSAELAESRGCQSAGGPCQTKGCVWGTWSDWAGCSCSCGGGQRSRDRRIVQVPSHGGRPCDVQDKEEIEPCNTHPCSRGHCLDGEWAQWGEWGVCSRTCSNGTTWRIRTVKHEANECGHPPTGLSIEHASCNVDIPCRTSQDCSLSAWAPWSLCTKPCSGTTWRSRWIEIMARNAGKPCEGALKQTRPCVDGCAPELKPVDCELGQWGPWSHCDVTCGQGQHNRQRRVLKAGGHGGRICNADFLETAVCQRPPCEACQPVDCVWEAWEDWGACDKCDGQRKRFRHVKIQPSCHGKDCEARASEEISNCTRRCHEETFCIWAAWTSWSECSETCGSRGRRSRSRHLQVVSQHALVAEASPTSHAIREEELSDMAEKVYSLQTRAQGLEEDRFAHLLMSFAFGSLSFVGAVTVVQHFAWGTPVLQPHLYRPVATTDSIPPGTARELMSRE